MREQAGIESNGEEPVPPKVMTFADTSSTDHLQARQEAQVFKRALDDAVPVPDRCLPATVEAETIFGPRTIEVGGVISRARREWARRNALTPEHFDDVLTAVCTAWLEEVSINARGQDRPGSTDPQPFGDQPEKIDQLKEVSKKAAE